MPGLMPLAVSYEGKGPRGLPLISVRHWYTQNGDVMWDPEMTFEVPAAGWEKPELWGPVTYRQDGLGLNQVAVMREDDGRVFIAPSLVRSLKSFMKTWDRNIAEQGFVEALSNTGATNGREDRAE